MASLSELVEYAKAKQRPNGLAELASNFVEGAGTGYQKSAEQARQQALKNQENPVVMDPITNTPQRLDVVNKLVDLHKKIADIKEAEQFNAMFDNINNNREAEARAGAITAVGQNASAPAPNTNATKLGKVASVELENSGGKITRRIKTKSPDEVQKSNAQQFKALMSGNPDDLTAAFPDGIPDWATKMFMERNTREMLAKAQINDYKLGKDVLAYSEKMENNPMLKEIKKQGLSLSQVDGILNMARSGNTVASTALGTKMARAMGEVGVLTDSDVHRYVESGKLSRSAGDKLSRWINGVPTDATLDEVQQIGDTLKSNFQSKVQPIYNTYAERLAKNYNLSPEEAAFRLDIPYAPVKPGNEAQPTASAGAQPDLKSGEVLRMAGGRQAVFNSATKQFVRWVQ